MKPGESSGATGRREGRRGRKHRSHDWLPAARILIHLYGDFTISLLPPAVPRGPHRAATMGLTDFGITVCPHRHYVRSRARAFEVGVLLFHRAVVVIVSLVVVLLGQALPFRPGPRAARLPGAGSKYQDCALSIRLDIYEHERASSLIYCACEGPQAKSCRDDASVNLHLRQGGGARSMIARIDA